MSEKVLQIYNFSFGGVALLVILTLKFTRRQKGFKVTPMDFLILFVALVVPNIPDQRIQSLHVGLLVAKMIAFFFTYEVLLGELRGELKKLTLGSVAALGVLLVRAVM